MGHDDFYGVKRIDGAVVDVVRSNLARCSKTHLSTSGGYQYTAVIEEMNACRVTSVKEQGVKMKDGMNVNIDRIYQNEKQQDSDEEMDSDDDVDSDDRMQIDFEKRPLKSRLVEFKTDDLHSMLIASTDHSVFKDALESELKYIRKTTTDGAYQIYFNAFLRRIFTYCRTLADAQNYIKGCQHRNRAYGFMDENEDAEKKIDLSSFGIKQKYSAVELILELDSNESYHNLRENVQKSLKARGVERSKLKSCQMIESFASKLGPKTRPQVITDYRGEMLGLKVMTTLMTRDYELKYCCMDKTGSQGIDQIWGSREAGGFIDKYVVVECKGSDSAHEKRSRAGQQMSEQWVVNSLLNIWGTGGRNARLVEKILTAASGKAHIRSLGQNDSVTPKVSLTLIESHFDSDISYQKGSEISFSVTDRGVLDLRRFFLPSKS